MHLAPTWRLVATTAAGVVLAFAFGGCGSQPAGPSTSTSAPPPDRSSAPAETGAHEHVARGAAGADSHGDSPAALSEGAEEDLYLTPSGKYTAADIEANGRTTAARKFRGIPSQHNAKTQSGDRICPISLTKASPRFHWIIGGKEYQFCPPCIDEFVRLAKESPDAVKEPSEYVKE